MNIRIVVGRFVCMQGPIRNLASIPKEKLDNQVNEEMERLRKTLSNHFSKYSIIDISKTTGVTIKRLYKFLNNKPDKPLKDRELISLTVLAKLLC